MIIVSNSSPLIALARVGKFSLLKELFSHIIIPPAVFKEVVLEGKGKPGEKEVKEASWIEVKEIPSKPTQELSGEEETLLLAQEIKADLVLLDEAPARRKAEVLNIKWTGTLEILAEAKRRGLIPEVKEILFNLRKQGFRMSEKVYKEVLKEAKEY